MATKEICPACKSKDMTVWMGGGNISDFLCNSCGYTGPVFNEEE